MQNTILFPLALLLTLNSISVSASAPSTAIYDIEIDTSHPLSAKVQIDTRAFPNMTMLPSRTMQDTAQPVLICQRSGQPDLPIDFGKEATCDRVVWTLTFSKATNDGIDISLQNNTYSPMDDWHLLSEWNSLPRIKGYENAQVCVNSDRINCRELPSMDAPPLFMVWGMEVNQIDLDGIPVSLMTDQKQLLQEKEKWLPILSKQIKYIKSVFDIGNVEPWSLVWFKREKSTGSISGAAGDRIYLSNVPVNDGKLIDDAYKHLLKISAHESIHFLSPISAPVWANEGLAEYYAIQSLRGTEYSFPDPTEAWQHMAADFPHGETGLYEASDLVTKEHNYQYYGLFYTKGVAFWSELDNALHIKGSSLKHYLPNLETKWATNLPQSFIQAITEKIGIETWRAIEGKYL